MNRPDRPASCDSPSCGCGPAPNRREVLQVLGASALAAMSRPWEALAGPFSLVDFTDLVPRDKKLRPEWLAGLVERGTPEVWKGEELRFLGMPVGGIGCGQLYLGGDGRLWFWDIFRPQPKPDAKNNRFAGTHYEFPPAGLEAAGDDEPLERSPIGEAPVEHGFALRVRRDGASTVRPLDHRGFSAITFRGEYPVARIHYSDPAVPVAVELEAFSPFVPLDLESSSLPATVLSFTLTNNSDSPLEVDLAGWLESAACRHGDGGLNLTRTTDVVRTTDPALAVVVGSVEPRPAGEVRPDILLEDWSKPNYGGWTVTGTAFGQGPIEKSGARDYQGDLGGPGGRLVNSHATAPGADVGQRDAATGTLTSSPFRLDRRFLAFWIGGGSHAGQTCLNLRVDGQVVRTATGRDNNRMAPASFDLRGLEGREAVLEIVDAATGAWGNIGVGPIRLTDQPAATRPEDVPGYGSIALALLGDPVALAATGLPVPTDPARALEALDRRRDARTTTDDLSTRTAAALARTVPLAPGAKATVTFLLTWFFPHYGPASSEMAAIAGFDDLKRHYAKRYKSALDVARHVARDFDHLAGLTRLWNRTWYDSTLPYWLLDRAFVTLDCLATQTLHGFDNGRWWGWEGVDCCPGTCQHVWQYGHAAARVQPAVERALREITDFGLAWRENGAIDYRSENARDVAHDGLCGTVVRAYREHTMCPDDAFLKRIWPRVRASVAFLMDQDRDADGLLEGVQYNTLDAAWAGPMGWISSLYLAALAAGAAMATEMSDADFAARCNTLLDRGRKNLVDRLYDGEYFIHLPPDFSRTNTNKGCHIDQVFGQSTAWSVGLPRVVPEPQCRSALNALWTYNFTPDVGPYRKGSPIKGGRWYAMPGEAGLLMCTWPKGGAEDAPGQGNATFVGYFNECMNGFEYQVAAHMVWEARRPDGSIDAPLLERGLAVTRAIHDRYAAALRNPFNEIECSDHYARSMASYAVFLAACGFEYHGPKAHLGFAPRMSPERFRAPFTAAEGWGTLSQTREGADQRSRIELHHGRLRLCTIALDAPTDADPKQVAVTIQNRPFAATHQRDGRRILIRLDREVHLGEGSSLEVRIVSG